jgi:hypothetical protein
MVLLTEKTTTIEYAIVDLSPNRKGMLGQIDVSKLVDLDFPQTSNFLCSLFLILIILKNYGMIIRSGFYVTAIFIAAPTIQSVCLLIHLIILGRTQF